MVGVETCVASGVVGVDDVDDDGGGGGSGAAPGDAIGRNVTFDRLGEMSLTLAALFIPTP